MDVNDLVSAINAEASSPNTLDIWDRVELAVAIDKLRDKIENPFEKAIRYLFGAHKAVALRLAVDMKVFDAAAGCQVITVDEIVAYTERKVDKSLIVRIMRHLTSMGLFYQLREDLYEPTAAVKAYVSTSPIAKAIVHFTFLNEAVASLPSFFMENGYKSPDETFNSPFNYAFNTHLHFDDWLQKNPEFYAAYEECQRLYRSVYNRKWFHYYPVEQKFILESPPETLLVDLNGGKSLDLLAFRKEFPHLQGKLVLQDVSEVLTSITEYIPPEIEVMEHHYSHPQPVIGARAYYVLNALHDIPDVHAIKFLQSVGKVMRDKSIFLVSEDVLPDLNVSEYAASLDLFKMAAHAATERTEKQFLTLFHNAGFKVVDTYAIRDNETKEGISGPLGQNRRRLFELVLQEPLIAQ